MAWSDARLREHLKAGGLSDAETEEYIEDARKLTECLDKRECPECKGKLSRKLDPRQAGPTSCAGSWFNYKCSCGYIVDRIEEPN